MKIVISWILWVTGMAIAAGMTFTLTSPVAQTQAPFTLGYTFCQGDIPSGSSVAADVTEFQADVKNRWPDGSVKFAILSGLANLSANTAKTVTLSAGSVQPGTALTETDLLNTGITASIGFGSIGTVDLRPLIGVASALSGQRYTAGRAQQVVSGPVMSSWVYYSPIGSDPHLAAWFEVRLYTGGNAAVLPWIENGYLRVASPGEKSGRAAFTLGGTKRYDSMDDANTAGGYSLDPVIDASGVVTMPHHTRIVLIRGGKFSHWLGTDPQILVKHDLDYLVQTRVVPAYRPPRIAESSLAELSATYNPMRVCYVNAGMGNVGYSPDIGMLPNSSALYMVSGDTRAYRAVMSAGFSLSSYCIHFRDEMTNRPLRFVQRPTLSFPGSVNPPAPAGRNSCTYASSHHPAAAYLPYLLSGWNYFAEELQFQITFHYLARNNNYRSDANYYFYPSAWGYATGENGGERAQAWQWRSTAMAASVTPDADTAMRNQLITVLGYNVTDYRQQFETGNARNPSGPNALGYGGFGFETYGEQLGTWQDDFMTAAVGLTWDLQVVTDPAKKADLLWYRDHKYKCITGRLGRAGVPSEWPFFRAAHYSGIKCGVISGSAFTWYTSWGECYTNTFGSNSTVSNTLIDGNMGDNTGLSTSYWGNLQPAIAYAVDHNAPGALEGYNRMVGADNWASSVGQFEITPVWSVMPRTVKYTSLEKAVVNAVRTPAMSVYPNPVKSAGFVSIGLDGASSFAVYSIQGKKIASLASGTWKADAAPGIYMVRAGNVTKRLVVLR